MKSVTTEAQYKQYFSDSFQGTNSFIDDVLSPIFGEFTPTTDPKGVDYVDDYDDESANIDHIYDYGKFYTDNTDVSVFEVVLSERCHISRARKGIRKAVSRITEQYSGAFIVFHYPEGSTNAEAQTWRLSWLKRLDVHKTDSPAKRYTYLCGPEYSCRTIAQRFNDLYKEKNKTLDSITKAFDAEALSEEFFKEYKVLYDDIVQWITGQRVIREGKQWKEEGSFGSGNGKDICNDFLKEFENIEETKEKERQASKAIRDYVKKMLGRLVFIQFLQKKGYLGIDGKPTQNFLLDLFNCITDEQKDNFIDTALEQVVYLLLNSDDRKPGSEVINNHTLEVPFLNGGLFERDKWDEKNVKLPKEFFHNEQYVDEKRDFRDTELRPNDMFLTQCGILDLFNHYNFTIDENDPNDAEVGVDPEMLGKIFENLLEDNKEKGAFYTPKEIVQYMCKESLIAYLCTKVTGHDDAIRAFVENPENLNVPEKDKVLDALKNVKICDPAIGSGAFPMGLLNLLVALREKLEPSKNRCDLKKDIIQKNIYGVDIEKGAIDIARLRFWLSIIVDEEVDEKNNNPTPLPNFDYKFMQGNSLLESFCGTDLSSLLDDKVTPNGKKGKQDAKNQYRAEFAEEDVIDNMRINLEDYFSISEHKKKEEKRTAINISVLEYIKKQGLSSEALEKLSTLDPSATTEFFLWHTWFKDVFDNGKFDIVIGNPPYVSVRTKNFDVSKKAIYKNTYSLAVGQYDLYTLFIEQSKLILNNKGVLAFIIPTRMLSNENFMAARNFVLQNIPIISYVNAQKPFENVDVEANIMICKKGVKPLKVDSFILNPNSKSFDYLSSVSYKSIELMPFSIFPFVFRNDIIKVFEKIQKKTSHRLEVYMDITRGFECGYNDEAIGFGSYKLIKSESIFPYSVRVEHDIMCSPDFHNVSKYKSESVFLNVPKLLTKFCSNVISFAIDEIGYCNTNSVYNCQVKDLSDINYLLAILNSHVTTFWFNTAFLNIDTIFPHIQKNQLEAIPIPQVNIEKKNEISSVVEKILTTKRGHPSADTSALESEINRLVYQIYGLTEDEIKMVEGRK